MPRIHYYTVFFFSFILASTTPVAAHPLAGSFELLPEAVCSESASFMLVGRRSHMLRPHTAAQLAPWRREPWNDRNLPRPSSPPSAYSAWDTFLEFWSAPKNTPGLLTSPPAADALPPNVHLPDPRPRRVPRDPRVVPGATLPDELVGGISLRPEFRRPYPDFNRRSDGDVDVLVVYQSMLRDSIQGGSWRERPELSVPALPSEAWPSQPNRDDPSANWRHRLHDPDRQSPSTVPEPSDRAFNDSLGLVHRVRPDVARLYEDRGWRPEIAERPLGLMIRRYETPPMVRRDLRGDGTDDR